MRLNWIEYENRDINLKIERVYFNKDITLLVGLTGSGKSQIINAIDILCDIAARSTESFQRVSGAMSFTVDESEYVWEVRTDFPEDGYVEPSGEKIVTDNRLHMMYYDFKTIISFEKLTCNDEIIFERGEGKNYIKGFQNIPAVDCSRSYISIYSLESILAKVYSSLFYLYPILNLSNSVNKYSIASYENALRKHIPRLTYCTDNEQKYNDNFPGTEPLVIKIPLLQKTNPNLWRNIFENYKAVFPEVDDIVIEPCSPISSAVTIFFIINDQKVDIGNISTGMIKILQQIVDILTASEKNVLLCDEIESGLGINCIDSIWDIIKKQSHNTQFIVTSHHPYIIGNLDYKKLKIVDRKDNVIKTYSGDALGLGDTHLETYDAVFNKLLYGAAK